jgi:hypothetical protein
VSALLAALAASVEHPHGSTAAKAGHTVWWDEVPGGYAVRCIPHGDVAHRATHEAAFFAALEHDMEMGGQGE